MVTYKIENNFLLIKETNKSLFGKEKTKETSIDLDGLSKIYILINNPTGVIATMTLYFGKKKRGVFLSDREQYKFLLDDLKAKFPDVYIERDTAGAW